jgi:hypothetical protein
MKRYDYIVKQYHIAGIVSIVNRKILETESQNQNLETFVSNLVHTTCVWNNQCRSKPNY